MPTIQDHEFGEISVKRIKRSRRISIRVTPKRTLAMSAPMLTPLFMMRQMIESSRPKLRSMLQQGTAEHPTYTDGDTIGKSHVLSLKPGDTLHSKLVKNQLIITYPNNRSSDDVDVQALVITLVAKTLRKEAKSYLPRRLAYLAEQHGYCYQTIRFSHASGRWGSCSSRGTISLNIALMKLPFELIDYVLLHELCHTVEMNHSPRFWTRVETADPDYKQHRKALKQHTPTI